MSDPRRHSGGRRWIRPVLLAGLGLIALLVWFHQGTASQAPVTLSKVFPWQRTPATSPTAGDGPALAPAAPTVDAAAASAPPGAASAVAGRKQPFRVDAQGRLIADQTLRLRLESLLALHTPAEVEARLAQETAELPAAAAARARELLAQMQAYQTAQRESFPPGQAPLLPEEGLSQLAALQALRATYLGSDTARAMFAEDDAVARRLLELMRQDSSTTLSMGEKAVRAQARYDTERGRVQP